MTLSILWFRIIGVKIKTKDFFICLDGRVKYLVDISRYQYKNKARLPHRQNDCRRRKTPPTTKPHECDIISSQLSLTIRKQFVSLSTKIKRRTFSLVSSLSFNLGSLSSIHSSTCSYRRNSEKFQHGA